MKLDKPLMKLVNLEKLHKSMLDQKQTRCLFPFVYDDVHFEIVFIAEEVPFILSIASKGESPIYFEIEVSEDYRIDIYLGDNYRKLCDALGFDPRNRHGFKTSNFFKRLNEEMPTRYTEKNVVPPEVALRHNRDVDEADKRYFMGWYRNKIGRPRTANLEKTKAGMGLNAYNMAVAQRLSSKWTDREDWATDDYYGDYGFIEPA